MSLLKLINKKVVNKEFNKGDWIYIKKKQSFFDKKITEFDGFIISIKKRNTNPIVTIIKKINNIKIRRVFLISSPLIISYKILKNRK